MKTEKEIRKQLKDVSKSNDMGFRDKNLYVSVLNWVLEEE